MADPLIRDISDTARWVAVYRARETERRDAVFRDPFARALAGERGERIADAMPFADQASWSFIARTVLFDRFIQHAVASGADLVLNLATGLDTRPYRMDLPKTLRWIEVDLPEILDYKESILGAAPPACALERVRLDLANHDARRGLFDRIGRSASNVVVVCEGLLGYLMPDEVCALGRDLAAQPTFRHWIVDLVSPGLLKMMMEHMGEMMKEAGAPLVFAPAEGPPFFERCGWTPGDVRSLLKAAFRLKRLPFKLRLFALFPEANGPQGARPWSGVLLLRRTV